MSNKLQKIKSLFVSLLLLLLSVSAYCSEVADEANRGRAALSKNDFQTATRHFYSMMDLYKGGHRKGVTSGDFVKGGGVLALQSRYIEAFEFYTEGIKLAESTGDSTAYVDCLNDIANIYNEFKDRDKAIYYYNLAFESSLHSKDKDVTGIILYNLVTTYCLKGLAKEAKRYLRLLMLHPVSNRHVNSYFVFCSQGNVANVEKNYSAAAFYFTQAVKLTRQFMKGSSYEAEALRWLAETRGKEGKNSEMVALLHQSLEVSLKGNSLSEQEQAYSDLAEYYRSAGKRDSLAKYLILSEEINEKIFDAQKFGHTKHQFEAFQDELQSQKMNSLHRTVQKQTVTIVIISLLMIACILLLIISIQRSLRLRQAYKAVIRSNKALLESNEANRLQAADSNPSPDDEVNDESDATALEQNPQKHMDDNDAEEETEDENEKSASQFVPDKETMDILCRRIGKIMDDNTTILNPDFTLQKLAQLSDSNTKYVSYAFRSLYHDSFKSRLNELRVREASRRITDTDSYGHLTIAAIALSVGYKSPTSFVRAFRKVLGMAPSTYKRLYEEDLLDSKAE